MKNQKLILKKNLSAIYNAPARIIVYSFLLIILLGGLLLSLPISSRDGVSSGLFNSLFTSASATCVTGLVIFDTYTKWTLFGQLVILTLIQIGGIGVITISIFLYVLGGKKLGLRGMQLAKESINITESEGLAELFKFIIKMTFLIEFLGAIILSFVFIKDFGFLKGWYISVFLAISAFCNAGFDILGFQSPYCSLIYYNNNPIVILTISFLIILGGLGFIVWYDLLKNKKHKLLLHTKVVLLMTVILIFFGTVVFFVLEYNNPLTIKNLSLSEKLSAAFFQSVTLRTAGFCSIDFSSLKQITKAIALMIMFVGGAPGSTSGGIKVTTLAILLMTVVSVIKNKPDTIILKHRVSKNIVYKSLSMLFLSLSIVLLGSVLVYYSVLSDEIVNVVNSMFETISAFSTVGVSTGVTEATGIFGKFILILIMFVGRVGPISLLLSLAFKKSDDSHKILPEGKIMVT
ncbi:MAG: hypothetical protein J6C55_01165 [Oscillospiraceae bacterium]|nr:hypothetical protein [Oscillospiraceae bacterium]